MCGAYSNEFYGEIIAWKSHEYANVTLFESTCLIKEESNTILGLQFNRQKCVIERDSKHRITNSIYDEKSLISEN